MNVIEISVGLDGGGNSQKVVIGAVSAQSAAAAATSVEKGSPLRYLVTPDVNCFARKGTNPTAVADGTDMLLLANNTYRVELMDGEKIAFITSGAAGNVYISPRG